MTKTYVVYALVGYQKSKHKKSLGQLVKTYVSYFDGGREQLQFSSNPDAGHYVTEKVDVKRGRCWYLSKTWLRPKDGIQFEIFTGYRGQGEDSQLTGRMLYVLDPEADVQEIHVPNIGPQRGCPLAKGRLILIGSDTKRDEHDRDLQAFLEDETGM